MRKHLETPLPYFKNGFWQCHKKNKKHISIVARGVIISTKTVLKTWLKNVRKKTVLKLCLLMQALVVLPRKESLRTAFHKTKSCNRTSCRNPPGHHVLFHCRTQKKVPIAALQTMSLPAAAVVKISSEKEEYPNNRTRGQLFGWKYKKVGKIIFA